MPRDEQRPDLLEHYVPVPAERRLADLSEAQTQEAGERDAALLALETDRQEVTTEAARPDLPPSTYCGVVNAARQIGLTGCGNNHVSIGDKLAQTLQTGRAHAHARNVGRKSLKRDADQ
ncbi:MAG: hypothetical protein LC804_26115 [Acidobacteria bacterium]|nr:hypothetical protein [Acidobacteriota bacterium]